MIDKKVTSTECNLVRLEPIIDILRTAIWTGMLGDEKPISVMLIAEQESAKTECLKYFRGTRTLRFISDLTSRGLRPYKQAIEKGRLRHIVLLDLVRIVSHGRAVTDRTMQSLAGLMEEGEAETSDAGGQDEWQNFPRVGVLMSITPQLFMSKRGKWRQTGFLTRFIPISFVYSLRTQHLIHTAIAQGHKLPDPRPENVPDLTYASTLTPEHASMLALCAEKLSVSTDSYGFRYHKVLRALAKARARMNGRGSVNIEDVEKVIEWSMFFTLRAVEL